MDIIYPAKTIDNSVKDQISGSPPECDCRVGIVNNLYQGWEISPLTTASVGDLSYNGGLGLIKTSWNSTTGALMGV
jgi:hypothetical protein